jgi:hypothetical protein
MVPATCTLSLRTSFKRELFYFLDSLLIVNDSLCPPGLQMQNSLTVEAKE